MFPKIYQDINFPTWGHITLERNLQGPTPPHLGVSDRDQCHANDLYLYLLYFYIPHLVLSACTNGLSNVLSILILRAVHVAELTKQILTLTVSSQPFMHKWGYVLLACAVPF